MDNNQARIIELLRRVRFRFNEISEDSRHCTVYVEGLALRTMVPTYTRSMDGLPTAQPANEGGAGRSIMKIEVFYIDGCPNHQRTVELVKELLQEFRSTGDVL